MPATAFIDTTKQIGSYRHNVYAFNPIADDEESIMMPVVVTKMVAEPPMTSAGFALPVPASIAKAQALEGGFPHSGSSHEDDGASDVAISDLSESNLGTPAPSVALSVPTPAAPTHVFRYASVNFRFGSAWFLAPFRTHEGDMVVVQYPGSNNSLHMGLVSCITTVKPTTFYSEENLDPNYLTEEEIALLPRLVRHARDFDKAAKLDLRDHDFHSLANAREVAKEMGVAVQFLDAEWLLDLSAVTFLVHVFEDAENCIDLLADEVASREGAEVVFTYPSA